MMVVIIALAPIVLFLWAFLVYATGFKRGTIIVATALIASVLFVCWVVFVVNYFK